MDKDQLNQLINDEINTDYQSDISPENYPEANSIKKGKLVKLNIGLDAEWCSSQALSYQVKIIGSFGDQNLEGNYIVINETFKNKLCLNTLKKFQNETNTIIIYDKLLVLGDPNTSIIKTLKMFLKRFIPFKELNEISHISSNIFIFYSPKDLNISFGMETMRAYYISKKVNQRRNIFGSFCIDYFLSKNKVKYIFKIRDLKGMTSSSLYEFASSFGISFNTKNSLDHLKTQMDVALLTETSTFLEYAIADSRVTLEIAIENLEASNNLLKDLFPNISEAKLYTLDTIPYTLGSFSFSFLQKYLDETLYDNNLAIKTAIYKLATLNPLSTNYKQNQKLFEVFDEIENFSDLNFKLTNDPKFKFEISQCLNKGKNFKYSPFEYCSSKFIQENAKDTTLIPLAKVTGGRCVNEDPYNTSIGEGCDIDVAGAYGNAFKKLNYPIGIPRFIKFNHTSRKNYTFGNFIRTILPKVKKGNWKCILSGDINFEQDLLFSRVMSITHQTKQANEYNYSNISTADIQRPLVLLKNELKNITMNQPTYDLLVKIADSKELGQIRKLQVDSAVYYLDKDEIISKEEFIENLLSDKGEIKYNKKLDSFEDTRTHKWLDFNISELIEKLLTRRNYYKNLKTKLGNAIQLTFKNLINTFYGLVCSIHFAFNNGC